MANKLILKNGAGVPAPEKLEVAELALDTEDGSLYSKLNDGTVVHLNEGGGSGGASVHIGEAPPADPEEGQQWLETPADGDAKMWIWDGAVWLEQPSSGGGSSDGGGSSLPYDDIFDDYRQLYMRGVICAEYHPTGESNFDTSANYGYGKFSGATTGDDISYAKIYSQNNKDFASSDYYQYSYSVEGDNQPLEGLYGIKGIWALWNSPYWLTQDFEFRMWAGRKNEKRPGVGAPLGCCHFYQGYFTEVRSDAYLDSDGNVMMSVRDVMDGFSAVKQAVSDEVTVEGLRDAIVNAVGGFIERIEAKQAEADALVKKGEEEYQAICDASDGKRPEEATNV